MNSEELEISLRKEFESYLKNSLAEVRQEISQLQEKVTTELERHKTQLDEIFNVASNALNTDLELDVSFKESVVEHLRLAKDEGAKITAMAIAQAEELDKQNNDREVVPSIGFKELHEAVNEISQKGSQSDILKTLVHHATIFAPRGAFFIVKNEHLVGWRVFGKEKGEAEEKVREVFLPVSADSIMSNAIQNLETIESSTDFYSDDKEVFKKLEFEKPNKMYAIPLVARGRGVAVLYADQDSNGSPVNVQALETLIKVAGLTVEVLASAKSPSGTKKSSKKAVENYFEEETAHHEPTQGYSYSNYQETEVTAPVSSSTSIVSEPVAKHSYQSSYVEEPTDFATESNANYEVEQNSNFSVNDSESYKTETVVSDNFSTDYAVENYSIPNTVEYTTTDSSYDNFESNSWSNSTDTATSNFSAQEFAENFAKETDPTEYAKDFSADVVTSTNDFDFSSSNNFPTSSQIETNYSEQKVETETFESTEEFVPTKDQTYGSFDEQKTQTVSQPISTPPSKSRLSERNVDLPIEVSEDERRLHNDARRFARLLVSEIKLYNEQKVKEGRETSDLYERLKEAIDRSREMYDKRVQPPVAAKFDYFHYELVNTLAEGDDHKLGAGYPGSAV